MASNDEPSFAQLVMRAVARQKPDPSFVATAAASIRKLQIAKKKVLTVHAIGGQPHVEGNDDLWILLADALKVQTLEVLVVGPDVRDRPARAYRGRVRVTHDAGAYAVDDRRVWRAAPDLILAFHAGFWGYDSWRPTLMGLLRTSIPIIVTSYTMEEARLDVRALGAATLEEGADDDAADAAAAALEFPGARRKTNAPARAAWLHRRRRAMTTARTTSLFVFAGGPSSGPTGGGRASERVCNVSIAQSLSYNCYKT